MQNIDNQGDKFKKFVEKLGLNVTEVAKKLDITRDTVYSWYGKNELKIKNIKKIAEAFNVSEEEIFGESPTLNQMVDWNNKVKQLNLLEKLNDSEEFKDEPIIKELASRINNPKTKPKEEITPLPYDDYMMVEYVDLSASAGMLGGSNVDLLPDTKKRLVPREFDKGNYLVVRVNGDSMTDGTDISIPDGVEILVKEHVLENGDKLPIRGNLFVICSREGNVFKQIVEHNTDLGYIRCHSYNPKYEDYNIPMDDVFQIFIYRKIVGYRPNIPEIR